MQVKTRASPLEPHLRPPERHAAAKALSSAPTEEARAMAQAVLDEYADAPQHIQAILRPILR